MCTLGSSFQSAVVGVTARTRTLLLERDKVRSGLLAATYRCAANFTAETDLLFPTVAFFSIFQVSVAAALPPIHGFGVWHVEEALSASRAEVALQLLQVALIEHAWKRMPVKKPVKKTNTVSNQTKGSAAVLFPATLRVDICSRLICLSHPVAAAMMQPPSSALAWQQSVLSWLMPKLWPISCAMVAATPTADSEWSYSGEETKETSLFSFWLHMANVVHSEHLVMTIEPQEIPSLLTLLSLTMFTPPDW